MHLSIYIIYKLSITIVYKIEEKCTTYSPRSQPPEPLSGLARLAPLRSMRPRAATPRPWPPALAFLCRARGAVRVVLTATCRRLWNRLYMCRGGLYIDITVAGDEDAILQLAMGSGAAGAWHICNVSRRRRPTHGWRSRAS